ncbi:MULTISPECIES: RluA family pseudouridine synthase [Clostridium]|uniref:Pseudouridine synthase n=2 Tax=Clostridium TaxID=1485 RepID=A0A151ARW5_9CLOT|nr:MULTISPECIES: RluA family pseudouridine synthase [Clostridium]KYH30323.1 ribosomal large subunit pseudouridine synthase C [Clostridium colicanis DSM 13634]MBE6044455.1 RluA family pseudouridine synthase [Clostridium thermopalmarium]PRR69437.1 Ribosomal large subunit pseudouridine synthase C [Clostridium thermopalmarium DSM 5974]PVZ26297.1 RluA family pseudouridine synthase [Clostridium thermopalmarium DSM 5974]
MRIEIGANESGQRVDKFCRKWLKDVPLGAIFKAFRKGDIRVNEKKVKQNYYLQEGDIVEVRYLESNKAKKPKEFQQVDFSSMKVTYEDENILILEKWPGILVHSDRKNGEPTLTDYALSYLYEKGDYNPESEVTFTPAPCNRLDRNTSGIVIYGKNFQSLKSLNEMIRERKIKKYYTTLVKGKIKEGMYEAYILKDEINNISQIFKDKKPNSKKISMEVKVMDTVGSYSLLEIELITGRSHQLRAHLAYLGNPIVGDDKYGDRKLNSFFHNKYGLSFQFLYAYKLIFRDCPEELSYMENKTITETLPPIFKKIKNDVLKF